MAEPLPNSGRFTLTQAHWHPQARTLLAHRKANGDGGLEALRVLKRRLSDVVYHALRADARADLPQAGLTEEQVTVPARTLDLA
jgi:hypothetical protein